MNSRIKKISGGLLAGVMVPGAAFACACGCGVFEVGTSAMFPDGIGGMAYVDYAFQNQDQNWSGNSKASSSQNDDKNITASFVTAGAQYMFDRSWGIQLELPTAYRSFSTGEPQTTAKWWSLGDMRLKGIYTGFSEDLSSGITFGLKLPTGDFTHDSSVVDRDSQIGTGSTDILLGGFHRGNLFEKYRLDYFVQTEADLPVLTQGDYRPGFELDAAAGINCKGLRLGRANISPLAQVIVSERTKDYGAEANSPNSGYTRILLSPGLEVHMHPLTLYADVEVPVFADVNGNQLVAPVLFKVSLSYMF